MKRDPVYMRLAEFRDRHQTRFRHADDGYNAERDTRAGHRGIIANGIERA